MRVLLLSDFYPPYSGGVEHHVAALAHGLVRRGHEVAVATLDGPTAKGAPESDGRVRIFRITGWIQAIPGAVSDGDRPWAPPIPDPGLARRLHAVVDEWAPDLIHGHDWLLRSVLPVAPKNTPIVSTLHYYTRTCAKKNLLRDGQACPGPAIRRCVPCSTAHYGRLKGIGIVAAARVGAAWERRATDATIAVSGACAEGNERDASAVEVIGNCRIDGVPATDMAGLPDDDYLLYVGDLRAEKGVPILIDAYSQLADPPPLVVIGGGDEPPAVRRGTDIRFLGERPHGQVLTAFQRCLFSIVPSIWSEPFGLVGLEAMAAGKAVVASDIGGLRDFIRHRENGLLVRPGDASALARAMAELLGDVELRVKLGEGAAATAAEHEPDRMIAQIESVYRALVPQ